MLELFFYPWRLFHNFFHLREAVFILLDTLFDLEVSFIKAVVDVQQRQVLLFEYLFEFFFNLFEHVFSAHASNVVFYSGNLLEKFTCVAKFLNLGFYTFELFDCREGREWFFPLLIREALLYFVSDPHFHVFLILLNLILDWPQKPNLAVHILLKIKEFLLAGVDHFQGLSNLRQQFLFNQLHKPIKNIRLHVSQRAQLEGSLADLGDCMLVLNHLFLIFLHPILIH